MHSVGSEQRLTGIFSMVFMPDISAKARVEQLADAEEITRITFKDKLGREPHKLTFEAEDPRNGVQQLLKLGWELKGAAWLDDNEAWEVTVTKAATELKCEAKRRP